ncbi:MAG: hypothetical protein IAF02_22950, partial [Anaerolineae bacterium]|nr:hypothetical protein [Anaerolineae bacterium]
ENANYPNPSTEEIGLQRVLGEVGIEITESRYSFLGLSNADYQQLKQKILTNWGEIIEIASEVPPKEKITSLLLQANGPGTPQEIGISEEEVELALRWGSYLRSRFTVLELLRMLSLIDWHKS